MWDLLRKINRGNLTIILTTHYMEEAEALCGRIAIIDKGKLDVVDTPQAMIDELGAFCVDEPEDGATVSKYFRNRTDAKWIQAGGCVTSPFTGKCYDSKFITW